MYKLNEIENFKNGMDHLIVHFILLLYSECLLENFGFSENGNDFYWAIKDYLSGFCLPATLKTKEEKVTEMGPILKHVPKFDARKGFFIDQNALFSFLEMTQWEYEPTSNTNRFIFSGDEFSWKSSFLKIVEMDGVPFCACYSEEDENGPVFRITSSTKDVIYERVKPYPFAKKAVPLDPRENKAILTDEEFFKVEELARLDNEQKNAVRSDIGKNVLVLAGAGSGKTRCIIARVAYLNLVKGIPLSRIALITFTRNTAQELQERIKRLYDNISLALGKAVKPEGLLPQTIDSFVYRLARLHYKDLYMNREPRFSDDVGSVSDISSTCELIIDQQGTRHSIYAHYFGADGKITPYVAYDLTKFFNGMAVNVPGIEVLANAYLNYEIEHCLFLDFSSLTYLFHLVLDENGESLKEAIINDFEAILIDEFQDVSIAQSKIFEPFFNGAIHFTFVGDDDQTIYGWRGSDTEVINRVRKLANCKQHNLVTNYRSNVAIVRAGNAILKIILNRAKDTECKAMDDNPNPIVVSTYDENYAQLLPEIDKLHSAGVPLSEILILVKTNEEGRAVSDALTAHGTPVRLHTDSIIGTDTYWLFNALASMACGAKSIQFADGIKYLFGLQEVQHTEKRIDGLVHGTVLPEGREEKMLSELGAAFRNPDDLEFVDVCLRYYHSFRPIAEALPNTLKSVGLTRESILQSDRLFQALQKAALNSEMKWPVPLSTLGAFFRNFEGKNLPALNASNRNMDGVCIYTIHSSKGLEADYVFILSMGQGLTPNTAAIDRQRKLLKDQLYHINQSRTKLEELKRSMTLELVQDAIRECEFNGFDSVERNWLKEFQGSLTRIKTDVSKLSPRGVSNFNDIYVKYILAIERKISAKLAELQRECERKMDELLAQKQKDALSQTVTNNSALYGQLQNEIQSLKNQIGRVSASLEGFKVGTKTIHQIYANCSLAEAYYSDIEKEKSLDEINALLNKTEAELKNEERRLFYVAVTRAGKKLYLLHPIGTKESEFIGLIPDELLARDDLLSFSEIGECQYAISSVRDRLVENNNEIAPRDAVIRIADKKIENNLNSFLDAFYESHPKCRFLTSKARSYFESAVKWDCLGKICSHEGAEYIVTVCLNKCIKELLVTKCLRGLPKPPTMTREDSKALFENVSKLSLRFPAPSLKKVQDAFLGIKEPESLVDCSLLLFAGSNPIYKSLGPDCYKELAVGESFNVQKLVCDCLDLSSALGQVIHKDETEWKERMLGVVFEVFFEIINQLL